MFLTYRLVSGAGDIKITKDGAVLLKEMQIQHPTASIIARAATSQDQITGDGTTSVVLFIGELLRHAERYLADGLHPRILTDGFLLANKRVESFIEQFKVKKEVLNHDFLSCVARTSLRYLLLHPLKITVTKFLELKLMPNLLINSPVL